MARKSKPLTVVTAVQRDLASVAKRDPDLAKSGLAASALALARAIDHPGNSATSKSMCSGQLRDTLAELRELAPAEQKDDKVDDLAARRKTRRGGEAS